MKYLVKTSEKSPKKRQLGLQSQSSSEGQLEGSQGGG